MTEPDSSLLRASVTSALADLSAGAPAADRRLIAIVYDELKRLARGKMNGQRNDHTLQPTALVHEAYLRLMGSEDDSPSFRDRRHFFAAAAAAMRSILVDHARRKQAEKRGGDRTRVALSQDLAAEELGERVIQVSDTLELFRADYPRQTEVIELLFFAGLSVAETAAALEVSERTVKRDWRFGKSWLLTRIRPRAS